MFIYRWNFDFSYCFIEWYSARSSAESLASSEIKNMKRTHPS